MSPARLLGALALAVGLAHLPLLPPALEDIDSVNFALGVRDFDIAEHRPHPPGYPVYIALGKAVAAIVGAASAGTAPSAIEVRALALVSLAAAMLLPALVYRLAAALRQARVETPPWRRLDIPALSAAILTVSAPLIWSLAVRPMSDLPGLAMALAAQACLAAAWWWQTPAPDGDRRLSPHHVLKSGRLIVLGGLLAGLAVGLRVQTFWLTAPMLVVVLFDRAGRGAAGALLGAAMTAAIGTLVWAAPLLAASGGLQGYLAALGSQAGEDFAGGEMLYLNPAPRMVALALVHTFVDPWESVPLATVVLALAAAGAVTLLVRDRRTLIAAVALGLPYLLFHLLFQDTSFTRYAAPLVPVVVLLALRGAGAVSPRAVGPAAAVLAVWSLAVGVPVVAEYAAAPAPAFRAVAAMTAAAAGSPPAVLAMHQTFSRPVEAEDVRFAPRLPSPVRREWQALGAHWLSSADDAAGPVWFLADPRRSDLALIDPVVRRDLVAFRWAPADRRIFGGMRPAAADWIRMRRPRWFAEDGWSLTPETAGMARLMGRGPHLGPIVARVRRDPIPVRLVVGGRHLGERADGPVRFTLVLDRQEVATWQAAPGFFLRVVDLPAGALAGDGPWATLSIASAAAAGAQPVPTAIEQFDLQPSGSLMWAFGDGWHEAEYSPALGIWHWTSRRAALRLWGAGAGVRVTMRVESPRRYFAGPSVVRAHAGGREIASSTMADSGTWSFEVPAGVLEADDSELIIETSQTFVPADRGGGGDRRPLGLRIFDVRVEPPGLR